jgi:hypothetical protein
MKNGVKKLVEKMSIGMLLVGMHAASFAQLKLSDIKGTSGAGTKDLTDLGKKGQDTFQAGIDLFLIGCAAVGIIVFSISMFGVYKAGKEDRESPKGAIFGLVVGAAMTLIPVLIGLFRNTFFVS